MFEQRSTQLEYIDNFSLSNDELIRNLNEIATINHWLGGYRVVKKALNTLLQKKLLLTQRELIIVDLGCGSGDVLRYVALWARRHKIKVKLIGVDANPAIIFYALQRSLHFPEISYIHQNIFSEAFHHQRFDIVLCNLFCHHLDHKTLIQVLNQLVRQASIAVVINDLHRHWLAYYGIKLLTRLFKGSYLLQHDAPLSVLRAFRHKELCDYLTQIPTSRFYIQRRWAFRYQVLMIF